MESLPKPLLRDFPKFQKTPNERDVLFPADHDFYNSKIVRIEAEDIRDSFESTQPILPSGRKDARDIGVNDIGVIAIGGFEKTVCSHGFRENVCNLPAGRIKQQIGIEGRRERPVFLPPTRENYKEAMSIRARTPCRSGPMPLRIQPNASMNVAAFQDKRPTFFRGKHSRKRREIPLKLRPFAVFAQQGKQGEQAFR